MKSAKILFFLILLTGFIIRIYNLSSIPTSLHVDEASIGYNAYRILTTGKDEYGIPFPLFFRAFGEYKDPVQIYSTVPFIFLFGLNEFSVRLTSVIYGVLGVMAIYLLTKELFKNSKHADDFALFSMLFLAISPWDIHFSRIAWEMMPFVFFSTFGLYLLLKAQTMPKLLLLAAFSFALAFYSYFAARLFIPFFGIGLLIIYYRFFITHKKETLASLILLIVLLTPFLLNLFSPIGLARWQQVSVFSQPPQNQTIPEHIAINYLQHFSTDFLFLKGDIGMPGQQSTYDSVRGMGELYLFQLPLILIGLWYLLKRRNKVFFVLLLWLLLYPTGSMFTDILNPLARRSVIGVIPFQILSGVGIVSFLQVFGKIPRLSWAVSMLVVIIIECSFCYYLFLYFVTYPNYSSDYWGFQYGSKQIAQYFTAHESAYDDLVMSPYIFSPYIYFDFYAPYGCQKCESGFPENYYNPSRKQLFALPPYYITAHPYYRYLPVKIINYPNGAIAFELVKIYQ